MCNGQGVVILTFWPIRVTDDVYRIFLSKYDKHMNKIFVALAEPNRLQIVELLRDRPCSVGEIVVELRLRQSQVSKHLRVLNDVGLVEVHPIANRRIYKLRPQPFKELDAWLNSYRHAWDERFDRLDDYLQELQGKEVCDSPKKY